MTADLGCLMMAVDGSEGSLYAHDGPLITSSVDLLLLTPLNPLAPSSSSFSNHHLLSLLDLISVPSLSVDSVICRYLPSRRRLKRIKGRLRRRF
ncbi:hypothetical protein NC652_014026 [Populus alba x Populus x berolinensis]|uniref:Uncharacterized protein n=1 Tax=Populus alba x Populus x berolinensis TaxID=444605 RepID=A0AAD6QVT2_9ROSI|nr:hypothetical protein NC652_014026 [Populus alba x Populus x berolinensis]KAJ6997598.1 hypothetical protein NC653_013994 [Populus alba x Populus x berolinensis]